MLKSITPDARFDFDSPQPDDEFTYDYVPMTKKDLELVGQNSLPADDQDPPTIRIEAPSFTPAPAKDDEDTIKNKPFSIDDTF